tara:strand:+ start:57 stop:2855 length:2799 start_codon:yes stop_codon:yes gene_type:complete
MARILDVSTESVREKIQLEGRPVNLSVSLESDGSFVSTSTAKVVKNYKFSTSGNGLVAGSTTTINFATFSDAETTFTVGDTITISGVSGGDWAEINGVHTILTIVDAGGSNGDRITINFDSAAFSGTFNVTDAIVSFVSTQAVNSSVNLGSIDIAPGRAVMTSSITFSSNAKGRISGVIAQNAIGDWIGLSNQDEFSLAVDSNGTTTLNFDGMILGPGSRVSLTFTPYSETGQLKPDLGVHINGIEFTADFNFDAKKKMLYCGDSISWSLVGNWKPQDMGYNYTGNRKESSNPYPDYFGDELASFRLVNALRAKASPESIRLVNKGFGGSKLATDQWFATRSGMYTFPWNIMVMQAGINDAADIQTPLRQLTMSQRIQDMVTMRNNNSRKKYPMVFCTPPIADDKYDGEDARVCLDQRPPIQGTSEAYTLTVDPSSVSTIDFDSSSGNHWIKVEKSGATNNSLTFSNGTADNVYRIDFITETNLLTGTTSSSYAWIRTLNSQLNPNDAGLQNDGIVTIPENTTLYIRCVSDGDQFEEIDRASFVGISLGATDTQFDTLDGEINHFITGKPSSATKILGPVIPGITKPNSLSANIDSMIPSRGLTQVGMGTDSGLELSKLNWPSASVIDQSDVWVKISGLQDNSGVTNHISWAEVNGYYKVVNYTTNTANLGEGPVDVVVNVQIQLDTRNSALRDFTGHYIASSGLLEVVNTRPYIAQFQASEYNTGSNYNYFEHGDVTIDDYKVKVQLTDSSQPFNLTYDSTSGKVKAICFSVYQQGNVIFMNEVVSGEITPAGKVLGASSVANFWAQTEVGLTRLKTVRKVITDTVNAYGDTDNVYLVDLYDIADLKSTTETTAGRLQYGEDNYKGDTSAASESVLLINDPIEDPVFKATGNSGVNERVMGKRLHRSPKGHELIFNRLNSVIGATNFEIPN